MTCVVHGTKLGYNYRKFSVWVRGSWWNSFVAGGGGGGGDLFPVLKNKVKNLHSSPALL